MGGNDSDFSWKGGWSQRYDVLDRQQETEWGTILWASFILITDWTSDPRTHLCLLIRDYSTSCSSLWDWTDRHLGIPKPVARSQTDSWWLTLKSMSLFPDNNKPLCDTDNHHSCTQIISWFSVKSHGQLCVKLTNVSLRWPFVQTGEVDNMNVSLKHLAPWLIKAITPWGNTGSRMSQQCCEAAWRYQCVWTFTPHVQRWLWVIISDLYFLSVCGKESFL